MVELPMDALFWMALVTLCIGLFAGVVISAGGCA